MKPELLKPRHLVIVRHGESEGDVRRASKQTIRKLSKHPKDEEQTKLGQEQSKVAGQWIAKFILQKYNIDKFDVCLTSPLIRTRQSAESLDISNDWVVEPRLTERDRGYIQGLTKQEHKAQYPASFQQMLDHPFHWTPPNGESILRLSMRFNDLLVDINNSYENTLMMTHRDVMWASHIYLDKLSLDDVENLNTDNIANGQIFHFSNINPFNGQICDDFRWKMSFNPYSDIENTEEWLDLKNFSERNNT